MRSAGWTLSGLLALAMPCAAAETEGGKAPPSLDGLLEIESEAAQSAATQPEASSDGGEADSASGDPGRDAEGSFAAALKSMRFAADRLGGELDPGMKTQRAQERVLQRLEKAIDQARSNRRRGGGGGRGAAGGAQQSKGASEGDQKGARGRQRGKGRPGEQGEEGQTGGATAGESTASASAGGTGGEGAPQEPSQRAGWGQLPPRVQQQLMQGMNERYSALYRRMTEAYYRKLAAQSSEDSGGEEAP